jgi:hypothetical protein
VSNQKDDIRMARSSGDGEIRAAKEEYHPVEFNWQSLLSSSPRERSSELAKGVPIVVQYSYDVTLDVSIPDWLFELVKNSVDLFIPKDDHSLVLNDSESEDIYD